MSNLSNPSIYQEIILHLYHHPHNHGHLEKPDADVHVVNSACGDKFRITVRMKKDTVHDVKFEGDGCAISVASASLITDAIKGLSKSDILKLTKDDVLKLLEVELTPTRLKCALLPLEGIHRALATI